MTYKAEAPSKKSDQLGHRPKRFWREAVAAQTVGGFEVHLDGRAVKTPQSHVLRLPTQALAEQVAIEWGKVGEYVGYEDMPLTRLGFAAVDRMDTLVSETVAEVLRYTETDLVCYPSEYPTALTEREDAAWLPLIQWAKDELGLVFLQNRTLIHTPQPADTATRIAALVEGASAYERAGLMSAIPLFGSVVLALAVWKGRIAGEAAFAASRVGEDFQTETWGRDEEAAKRAASMQVQAKSLDIWFRSL
jgi:chaperone required for assembly of F1-ATPase